MKSSPLVLLLALAGLAACGTGPERRTFAAEVDAGTAIPPSAPPDSCWAVDRGPASPFRPAPETWFEVPCPQDIDDAFIASLQRALAARGLHAGDITGEMDAATRAAVRRYQLPMGLSSDILSIAAARRLGLVVTPSPDPA